MVNWLLIIAAAAITSAMCFRANYVADRFKLFDYPRGGRKHHVAPTPQVGGLAIFLPLALWLLVESAVGSQDPFYRATLLSAGGVALVGVMDDQSHLSPGLRLVLLADFALIAFALDSSLAAPAIHWASFGPTTLPVWLFVSLAVIAIAGFVSSVNMADGIDGLVPSLFLIWCMAYVAFGDGAVRQLAIVLTGPVAILLVFNLRGKVFLGDCGTFGLGFVFSLMAIASLRSGKISAETLLVWYFIPVVDCLRVIATRLIAGRSPLKGGKDHFHHMLAEALGKRLAFYVYAVLVLVTSIIAALFPRSGTVLLIALAGVCLGFVIAKAAVERRTLPGVEGRGQPATNPVAKTVANLAHPRANRSTKI